MSDNIKVIPIIINAKSENSTTENHKDSKIQLQFDSNTISLDLSNDNISLNVNGQDITIPKL